MRPPRRWTIRDVAKSACVSPTAVSRFLNGSINLPPQTAERIQAAIRELGYKPNPHARRLSLGRSDTFALVIPDISNPFFARLASAVEEAADEGGMSVVLCATLNRPGRELSYLERLHDNQVDGLLFLTNHADDGSLRRLIDAQPGIVLLDEDVAGTEVPKVFADNEGGGRLAARHLLSAGHRDVAFIGGPFDMMSTAERLAGFRSALTEQGLALRQECLFFGSYTAGHGRAASEALLRLDARPTAIFAAADEIALGVLETFATHGIAVPQAMSLVAFDDVSPLHLFRPPVTAIRQPVREMGRKGVALVLGQISGEAPVAETVRLPVEIVVRQSVGSPARDA